MSGEVKRGRGRPRKHPRPEDTQTVPAPVAGTPENSTTAADESSALPPPQDTVTQPPKSVDNPDTQTAPAWGEGMPPGVLNVDEVVQRVLQQAEQGDAPAEVNDFHDLTAAPDAWPKGFPKFIEMGERGQVEIQPVIVGRDDVETHLLVRSGVAVPVTKNNQNFKDIPRYLFGTDGILRRKRDFVYYCSVKAKKQVKDAVKSRGPIGQLARRMVDPGGQGGVRKDVHEYEEGGQKMGAWSEELAQEFPGGKPVSASTGR